MKNLVHLMTNGFIFQIINSLIESWGVRLTWFGCNELIIRKMNPLVAPVTGVKFNLAFCMHNEQ